MYTQITCPNCGTPYSAEVHQVVDAQHTPELKQRLLDGSLNMAVCPNCGAGGQLTTILLFHDANYDLFMVYVPQEMQLNQVQREQAIGRLTQSVIDNLPAEERRAYMLQPQIIINMQTFMEKVLETEGITKEMIARQQKQTELVQKLAQADKDVQDFLLKERANEIDETFFAILQSFVDMASQINNDEQLLPLLNLSARLMRETAVGQQLERRQLAVHRLSQAAKKAGGLSPQLLAEQVVANQEEADIVQAVVTAGQGALQYEFFSHLTSEIEKAEQAGDLKSAKRLTDYRTTYLQMFQEMQQASQKMMGDATNTLQTLLDAPDKTTAVMELEDKIDDAFMYLLSMRIDQAEKAGNQAEIQALYEVQAVVMGVVEDQMPPELQLINHLTRAQSEAEVEQLLTAQPSLVSADLLELIDQIRVQAAEAGQVELDGRLQAVKTAVQKKLLQ